MSSISTVHRSSGRRRVLHVLQSLEVGGLERVVLGLVRASAENVDSAVVATHNDGPLRADLEAAGAQVWCLHAGAGVQPRLPLAIARIARSFRADVLHSHHLGPFLYTAPASALVGVPHVHTEHSHEFYNTPRRRLLGRVMHRWAHVVACSSAVARFHHDNFAATVDVIDNGVDIPVDVTAPVDATARAVARRAFNIEDDSNEAAVVIGCVARLAPEKNHAMLLEAFARVVGARAAHRPPVRLVLIGDGSTRAALTEQVAALGLSSSVRFLGSRSDVAALWAGIDVAALTSRREGLPLALLEGLAAGVPFVATDVGGIGDLRAGGMTVDVDDVDACAKALTGLIDDVVLRRRLGAAGRAEVSAHYSTRAMAHAYQAVWA